MFLVSDLPAAKIAKFLALYGLYSRQFPLHLAVPFSFWGSPEAGRRGNCLYVRADTPLHSLLHESAHFVCMPSNLRHQPSIDAGGNAIEESACCYLQLLWSTHLSPFTLSRHCQDMDAWGYSFRLGSAQRWFEEDAEDAHRWLVCHGIIDSHGEPSWNLRA